MFIRGTSLAIQWLKLLTTISGGTGSIPGWGTKILHAAWCGQKKKEKRKKKSICKREKEVNGDNL